MYVGWEGDLREGMGVSQDEAVVHMLLKYTCCSWLCKLMKKCQSYEAGCWYEIVPFPPLPLAVAY